MAKPRRWPTPEQLAVRERVTTRQQIANTVTSLGRSLSVCLAVVFVAWCARDVLVAYAENKEPGEPAAFSLKVAGWLELKFTLPTAVVLGVTSLFAKERWLRKRTIKRLS